MIIQKLDSNNDKFIKECAGLLLECFDHSWNTISEALDEISLCLENDAIVLVAVEDDRVVGFIGGRVQYIPYGWELHPLAVSNSYQRRGVGTLLVHAFESEVRKRGAEVIFLGADDENGSTSLSGCDLFEDTFEKIQNIKNIKNHPFEFYMKNGYKIVGVLPDANGYGKPDIHMAKRIK